MYIFKFAKAFYLAKNSKFYIWTIKSLLKISSKLFTPIIKGVNFDEIFKAFFHPLGFGVKKNALKILFTDHLIFRNQCFHNCPCDQVSDCTN